MRINNNASANMIWRQGFSINKALDQSLERLSSGRRLNRASDGAADLALSDKYRAQAGTLAVGERNIQNNLSYMNTIDAALSELSDIGQRGVELSMAYASTSDTAARSAMSAEWDAMFDRVASLVTSLSVNGVALGGINSLAVQVDETNNFSFATPNIVAASVTPEGAGGTAVSLPATMTSTVADFTGYVNAVAQARATLGGSMAALESQLAVNMAKRQALNANESLLRDTDVAAESTRLTRAQILSQSNVAMLAQANARPMNLLALLR